VIAQKNSFKFQLFVGVVCYRTSVIIMSAAIRSLYKQKALQRLCACTVTRLYARGTTLTDSGDDSVDRVPSRVKRRLEKQGVSVDEYLREMAVEFPEPLKPQKGNIIPPPSASANFPQTDQQLQSMLHDMKGEAPEFRLAEEFPSDLRKQERWLRDQSKKAYRPKVDPATTSIILFPGQGSQFVGMGGSARDYGQAKELFEEASAVLGYDLLKMCLSGPISTLSKTIHCQPAVLVSSLAAIEKLKEQNPEVHLYIFIQILYKDNY
jgi:hypothetical protein